MADSPPKPKTTKSRRSSDKSRQSSDKSRGSSDKSRGSSDKSRGSSDKSRRSSADPGKSLVIVESPAKARTINKILGAGFEVKASMGHVRDLPTSRFGVDVEEGFRPRYQLVRGRKKVVDELRKAAGQAGRIFLAPDPDREGEAIAWHLREVLASGKSGESDPDRFQRVSFNEITPTAVRHAFEHPGPIDMHKVDSQQARRILDRIVGYRLSPLLWKKVQRGLSAGRVQSVALRLICDRELEIRAFEPREYWTIDAVLERNPDERFKARLARINGEKAEVTDEATATRIAGHLRAADLRVSSVVERPKRRMPAPPFITSTLQQAASSTLRISTAQTMMLAQQLYEGIDLGPRGSVGLITYMRTDAPRVSREAQQAARAVVAEMYGDTYLPAQPPAYRSRSRAQEAHEAIRPADPHLRPADVEPYLGPRQLKLYTLIWNRFMASQMAPAQLVTTSVDVEGRAPGVDDVYTLRAASTRVEFDGWMRIAGSVAASAAPSSSRQPDAATEDEELPETALPALREGDAATLVELDPSQHFTEPPPRYSEASLVRAMEERGIGRPSTYAPIVATIQKRKYVDKVKRRLHPTELGMTVNGLLVEHFPDLVNFEFTARMEDELDRVEQGDEDWRDLLTRYHVDFEKALEKATEGMRDVRREVRPTDVKCPECEAPMVIRWGRSGEFLSCSRYPECKASSSFHRGENEEIIVDAVEETDEVCEKCGKPMLIRRGRFGRFLACSGYPECKATRPLPTGVGCPQPGCEGTLVQRRSRRRGGSVFYGCSRYPDCDYTTRSLDDVAPRVVAPPDGDGARAPGAGAGDGGNGGDGTDDSGTDNRSDG